MYGVIQFAQVDYGGIPRQFPPLPGGGYKVIKHLLNKDEIIVNTSLMEALQEYYGKKEGEEVYVGMMGDSKKPFLKGIRTADKHGHLGVFKLKHHLKK